MVKEPQPFTVRRSPFTLIPLAVVLLLGASAASGADLLEIYRLAQSSDAQYAAARAAWSASQEST